MRVRIAKNIRQPVLFSYFLSDYSAKTEAILKKSKPLTSYHAKTKEYETVEEILEKIEEPIVEVIDERYELPKFERKTAGKYGYQQDAVEFARQTSNLLLNFGQGMGKSLTTMKIILDQRISKSLIICGQSNLQEEWLKDAEKHGLADTLNIRIVGEDTGASSLKKLKWLEQNKGTAGIDLINIEALRRIDIVKALNGKEYGCIVIDEVQSAKGWKAEQTKGVHALFRFYGQKRIALSGTPVLNSPLEFFSLLKFLGCLENTARTTFERYYGKWTFDFWGHFVCEGFRNIDKLAELLAPVICLVSKEELDLPPKYRELAPLKWEANEEYEALETIHGKSSAQLARAGFKSKAEVRVKMRILSSTAEPKKQYALERMQLGRLLLFSQWTTVLEDYARFLESKGIKYLYYHGKLSMKQRLEVLERWRTEEIPIMLMSVQCSRFGLNLQEATQILFVDVPTSLAIVDQCEDRAHRIGQEKAVHSRIAVCSSLDEEALNRVAFKQGGLDIVTESFE